MDNLERSIILKRAKSISNKELACELDYKFRREKRVLEHTPALFRTPADKRRLATLQALSRALQC